MSALVNPSEIEGIVGVTRHATEHWGRAVSNEQQVYVLHAAGCLARGGDLRDCEFSRAMDNGLDNQAWAGYEDRPVRLAIADGWLVPRASASG